MHFGPHAYRPEEFLRQANAKPAQEELFAEPDYEFVQPFDLIFVGTCSSGNGHGYFHHTLKWSEGFICVSVNPEFFKQDMEAVRPKRVLLISECCGQFSPGIIEEIKRLYPDVEWVTPPISDYCERPQVERVVDDLSDTGILRRKS